MPLRERIVRKSPADFRSFLVSCDFSKSDYMLPTNAVNKEYEWIKGRASGVDAKAESYPTLARCAVGGRPGDPNGSGFF